MMEYTFGQTRASLELLKQNVEVLKAEIEAVKNKISIQNENNTTSGSVCSDEVRKKLEQTLQKIDETTAIIDEVLK